MTWVLVNVGGSTIYQQRYDKNGERCSRMEADNLGPGGEDVIKPHTNNPVVMALADGGWVVTWGSRGQDETVHSIYQQKYDSAGNPQFTNQDGAPLDWRATVPAAHDRFRQATTALDDGGWVVTSVGANGIDHAIYQTRLRIGRIPRHGGFRHRDKRGRGPEDQSGRPVGRGPSRRPRRHGHHRDDLRRPPRPACAHDPGQFRDSARLCRRRPLRGGGPRTIVGFQDL